MRLLQLFSALLVLTFTTHCNGLFVVPEELQTLLQLFYSFLPTISTGTDSKVGVGFRLGRNADFQVLLELGPQIQNANGNGNSKKRQIGSSNPIAQGNPHTSTANLMDVNSSKVNVEENEIPTDLENITRKGVVVNSTRALDTISNLNYTDRNDGQTPGQKVQSTGIQRLIKAVTSIFN